MGSLGPNHWPLILALLQIQLGKIQGLDSASQKLRRLNEQFLQFQALTEARLNMLALNQNRNSTWGLESRVQALNDRYHHMSQDLEHLRQSTAQEIQGLRGWSQKLEKKTKRMEGRLASMERNLRENLCYGQKEKPDPSQDLLNLTLDFQSQEERLAALQVQRDELLVGLKGLQESVKNQALRVTQLEGRLGEVLQLNGGGTIRGSGKVVGPISSIITPQEYYEPLKRTPYRQARPRRILNGHTQLRPEGIRKTKSDSLSQATPYQYYSTNQPKHSKAQKPKPQSQILGEHPTPKSQFLGPYPPQSQIQVQAQTRPYPIHQEQLQSQRTVLYDDAIIQTQVQQPFQPHLHPQRQPPSNNSSLPSLPRPLSKAQTHPETTKDRQSRTKVWEPHQQASDLLPQPQSESYQPQSRGFKDEEDVQNHTKIESSVIHNLLQLPVRHKIPAQPVPKRDATICNVKSLLFFPSASAENYVTFSSSLPDLHEFSVCLWLRVEASYVGTLLSYATDDNDNQLVLYGRNPAAFSKSFQGYSSSTSEPSHASSLFSPSSSPSLDLVIGDPVYRRLPTSSLLDARWHHLCFLWSSIQGRFWHYNGRRLISSTSNFRKGWEIPGGGSVVLGQEQDTVGGGFDPAEGFVGQVAGFRVWNRVLSPSEVEGVAEGRGVPRGVMLDMEDIKEVHGEVQQVACECLEHCV
ncbi:hypothetical protein Q5P01_017531 [Channa striata]|uniref:Pentraxin (PTX) domain-containing protein n=1 Tax=Channa striata TaxID=64152 RepID=A0AA88MCH2_CHASR|nr:hypothetical protein Q5P01_017531 [Channa striata]